MPKGIESLHSKIFIDLLPERIYKIKISEKDYFSAKLIENELINNPNLNFILYFNHISYNDPLLAAHIAKKIDSKRTRHLIAPVSYSHTEPGKTVNRGFSLMINLAERCGIEMVRVIQSYQVDNPDYGYSEKDAQSTYRTWMRRLKELQTLNNPTGCIISPEGHRSNNGKLGQGEAGIVATGKLLAPAVYIPLGISYSGDYKRSSLNFGKELQISIGETIYQEDRKNGPELEEIMHNLAMTLPPDMRGDWSE